MGLDMYLYKKTYIGANWEHNNVKGIIELTEGEDNHPIPIQLNRVSTIVESVGYWNKAYHIHQWFVENVQSFEGDCGEYYVSREQLLRLVRLCKVVLENKEAVKDILPIPEGFLLGDVEYGDWYFDALQYTIDMLTPLIREVGGEYYYTPSW